MKYAVIYNPDLSVIEMLQTICDSFNIPFTKELTKRELLANINTFLIDCANNNKRAILLIDEAQHLSDEVIEQVRLLTNFETNNTKLLQVVLIGQPELMSKLKQQHMRQIAQRITARFHLLPLSVTEVDSYVRFRLQSAGCIQVLFNYPAIKQLFKFSQGIPRIINVIADRALLAAYVDKSYTVEAKHVKKAAEEVFGEKFSSSISNFNISAKFSNFLRGKTLKALACMIIGGFLGYAIFNSVQLDNVRSDVVAKLKSDVDIQNLKQQLQELNNNFASNVSKKREQSRYDADILNSTLEEGAWHNLLQEWGFANFNGDIDSSCNMIKTSGLRCLATNGSLEDIEKNNIQVEMQLLNESLTPFYVVLLALSPKYAVILMNGREWIVKRSWLSQAMEGDYRLIWPLPNGEELIKVNSSQQTQKALGEIVAKFWNDDAYKFNGWDANLVKRIKNIQESFGLKPDGIVGINTLWGLLPYTAHEHKIIKTDDEILGEFKDIVSTDSVQELSITKSLTSDIAPLNQNEANEEQNEIEESLDENLEEQDNSIELNDANLEVEPSLNKKSQATSNTPKKSEVTKEELKVEKKANTSNLNIDLDEI